MVVKARLSVHREAHKHSVLLRQLRIYELCLSQYKGYLDG